MLERYLKIFILTGCIVSGTILGSSQASAGFFDVVCDMLEVL